MRRALAKRKETEQSAKLTTNNLAVLDDNSPISAQLKNNDIAEIYKENFTPKRSVSMTPPRSGEREKT